MTSRDHTIDLSMYKESATLRTSGGASSLPWHLPLCLEFDRLLCCRLSATFTHPLSALLSKPRQNGLRWENMFVTQPSREIVCGEWYRRGHLWLGKAQQINSLIGGAPMSSQVPLTDGNGRKSIRMGKTPLAFCIQVITMLSKPHLQYNHTFKHPHKVL